MLSELFRKVKMFCAGHGRELFLITLLALIAAASFGFGRLSAVWQKKEQITIELPSASDKMPQPAVEGAAAAGVATTPPKDSTTSGTTKPQGTFIASKKGSAYHFPWCPGAKQIKDTNKIWFETRAEAAAAGYKPAGNCPGL